MIGAILLALHLLAAVLWVGGMAFALLVLRPSLFMLDPLQRLSLHKEVFRRFFRLVWHVMPIQLATGYAMIFLSPGGFAALPWAINAMQTLGLIMAALFLVIFFGPWAALRRDGEAQAVERIRRLIAVNLGLGLVTVAIAAFS
jgi:uncharacterized membrane protein